MNKLLYFSCLLIMLMATSCLQDEDDINPNTNPFDSDYIYDLVEFDRLVELAQINVQGGIACYEIFSVKLSEETKNALSKINTSLVGPFVEVGDAIELYPFAGAGQYIHLSDIPSDGFFTLETSAFNNSCNATRVCADVSIVYIREDKTPPYNHKVYSSKIQKVCFNRTL